MPTPHTSRARPRLVGGGALALLLVGAALLPAHPASAQQAIRGYDYANPLNTARGLEPTVRTQAVQPIEMVEMRLMPGVDREALRLEDEIRAEQNLPHRFAVPNEVRYTPGTAGTWEHLDDATWLWRLRVIAPEAVSVNFGFTKYDMPEGGTLFIYATDGSAQLRAFTAADNESHGQLWTPPLPGDDMTIEVTVPAAAKDDLVLELTRINHGYRGFHAKDAVDSQSGSCNVDVACPESAGWEDEIAGVAVIAYDGSLNCTGFLVNNTSMDRTPYFMTAFHCGVTSANAATLIAFWNYENSTCRIPGSAASGQPGDGVLEDFNTGSFFRAAYQPSDFTLLELDDDPDPVFGATFLGWHRDPTISSFEPAVAIHHPSTEEKRISFEDQPVTTTSYGGSVSPGDGTHLRVADWDLGTTEGGSSGSPLFNSSHQVIGQLHGGGAACGNDFPDWYGRFSVSWTGGGTPGTRLSDWLNPFNSTSKFIPTLGPLIDCNRNGLHDPQEIAADPSIDCNGNGQPDDCDLGSYINEGMDSAGALDEYGWVVINNSDPVGPTTWGQITEDPALLPAHSGSLNSRVLVDWQSAGESGAVSNWLISPEVDLIDGKTFTFWTRKVAEVPGMEFPDRLQVRLSTNGSSTNVGTTASSFGDFTTLLEDINPTLAVGGYPTTWTKYELTLSGLGAPTTGRFAFRYYIPNNSADGNLIGIDTVTYFSGANDSNGDGVPDECAACVGDVDTDGMVGIEDLLDLLADWGPCPAPCPTDLDGSGAVDIDDLLDLLAAWGPC